MFILILEFVSAFYFSIQQAANEEFITWQNQPSQRQTPFPEVTQQSLTAGDISFLVIRMKSHTGSEQFSKRPVLQALLHRRYFPHGLVSTDGLSVTPTDPQDENLEN